MTLLGPLIRQSHLFSRRIARNPWLSRSFHISAFKSGPADEIIHNEMINFDQVRLVLNEPDPVSGQKWKIVTSKQALLIAQNAGLDLILVSGDSNPPVCRIDSLGRIILDKKEKEKEMRISQKSSAPKEIRLGADIDKHDLEIKVKHIKQFLDDGHPVRVVLSLKKYKDEPLEKLDTITVKVLDYLKGPGISVQKFDDPDSEKRRDLLFSKVKSKSNKKE